MKGAEIPAENQSSHGKALWDRFKKLSQFSIMLQTMLDEEPEPEYPKVNVDLVYPNALTPQEVNNVFERLPVKHKYSK